MNIAPLIRKRLDELGLSPYQASVRAGLKQDAIRYILEGREPGFAKALAVMAALDIPFAVGDAAAHVAKSDDDVTYVVELDFVFSAGHGIYPTDHPLEVTRCAFSTRWLQHKGLNPKNLILARIHGDSMEPMLKDKDVVMLDRSITKPTPTLPMAFMLEDTLYIKMYQATGDNRHAFFSVNKAYETILIDPAAPPKTYKLFGAVVWQAHSWI